MRIYKYIYNNFLAILLFALLISLDQSSKYIIRSWGGFYICNPNISFGIKINQGLFYVLWVCIILCIFLLANSKFKILNPKQSQNSNILNSKQIWILDFSNFNLFRIWDLEFGILFILSGAISNILDRLYFGCIVDFIKLPYWLVFNLADAFISIGVIISVWHLIKNK